MDSLVRDVQAFWNANPCGALNVAVPLGTPQFFLDYEHYRYESEPYILQLLDLKHVRGRRVVEIGCGIGTDGVQFAKAGAHYCGIDLTEAGTRLTKRNLELRGLPGTSLRAQAEHLPLATDSVDLVYSHGVIHHAPSIELAVAEIWRILKPGAHLHLMLYHSNSFNYRVSIQVLRRLGALLLIPRFGIQCAQRLSNEPAANLEIHRRRLLEQGPRYLFGSEWLSRNTDGPNNPLSRVYTRKTATTLLKGFTQLRFVIVNLNRRHLPVIRNMLTPRLEHCLAARYGWHLHIYARKPTGD